MGFCFSIQHLKLFISVVRLLRTGTLEQDITWHRAAREDWGRSAAAEVGFGAPDGQEARGGRSRRQQCPEMKTARSWARSSARRLTFYAPYWIVNKTGLALNYRARYLFLVTPSIVSGLRVKLAMLCFWRITTVPGIFPITPSFVSDLEVKLAMLCVAV